MNNEDMMTTKDVAHYLGVSVSTVHYMCTRPLHKLKRTYHKGRYSYLTSDVENFAEDYRKHKHVYKPDSVTCDESTSQDTNLSSVLDHLMKTCMKNLRRINHDRSAYHAQMSTLSDEDREKYYTSSYSMGSQLLSISLKEELDLVKKIMDLKVS